MMKSEFENLIGCAILFDDYKKVETVYMTWDYEEMSKEKIANLYRQDKKFVTVTLYNLVAQNEELSLKLRNSKKEKNDLRNLQKRLETQLLDAHKEVEIMTSAILELGKKLRIYKARNEELETQLHQYKALFADIEKNMTVDLYKTLLGVAE